MQEGTAVATIELASNPAVEVALPRFRRRNAASARLEGRRVLVSGGDAAGGDGYEARTELWDPASRRWLPAGGSSVGRRHHTLSPLPGGRALTVGGREIHRAYFESSGRLNKDRSWVESHYRPTSSVEIWHPETTADVGRFTIAPALPAPRENHTGTVLDDGRVLIAGGSGDRQTLVWKDEA